MADKRFVVTDALIKADPLVSQLVTAEAGAVVTFVGVVRGNSEGRQVLHLEYEAYPGMAEAVMQQIAEEVRARWPDVQGVAITHRVGRLEVGETAVVIALSAAHRPSVFDALHYTIDRVKEIVPIWKKEVWADGSEWKSEQ